MRGHLYLEVDDPSSRWRTAADAFDDLVRCGQYPFWGPFAGGRASNPATSSRGGPITPFEAAHRFALGALPNGGDYVSFGNAATGGVAIRKNLTDGPAIVAFSPTGCFNPLAEQTILPD
jgi:hypothetical protein